MSVDPSEDRLRTVTVGEWGAAAEQERDAGFAYLDLFAGIDRQDCVEVVARFLRIDPAAERSGVRLITRVPPGTRLPSLVSAFPAAAWHERELAEMFGVEVSTDRGTDVPMPALLRRHRLGAPPLLRSTVLAARVARPWPGSAAGADDRRGSRRRQGPPGVAVDWLDESEPPEGGR